MLMCPLLFFQTFAEEGKNQMCLADCLGTWVWISLCMCVNVCVFGNDYDKFYADAACNSID